MSELVERVARAICKSRSCEGINCCQWPANMGRSKCPVNERGYDDAAQDAIAVFESALLLERAKTIEGVPVSDWPGVVGARVLLYVVHDHAQYEKDEAERLSEWECWVTGYWTGFNKGGWVWNGMSGIVTHVAPLPAVPSVRLGRNPMHPFSARSLPVTDR